MDNDRLPKKLAQSLVAASPGTTLYTAGALAAVVTHISLVNVAVASTTIALYQSGTSGVNTLLPAITLDTGEFAEWDGEIVLPPGDTLSAIAANASRIAATVHGYLVKE